VSYFLLEGWRQDKAGSKQSHYISPPP